MKNMLILGATSSLARPFLNIALDEGFGVFATNRNSVSLFENSNLKWLHLDLESQNSINRFLESIANKKFDLIIDFIGENSQLELHNLEIIKLNKYFSAQITNHIFLLLKIQSLINPNGALINMSTRSVKYGSFDIPYAAAKSAIHSTIFSLRNKFLENQKVINIVSGLIENSSMFNQMTLENISNHRQRAVKDLLTPVEFANALIEICKNTKDNEFNNYSEIIIGPDYE